MNYDEFAFFNQQLGAMLREGLPLEGALKQLSAGMRSGPLRAEVEALNEDLASGTPFKEALARRQLPDRALGRAQRAGSAGEWHRLTAARALVQRVRVQPQGRFLVLGDGRRVDDGLLDVVDVGAVADGLGDLPVKL